MGFMDKAKAWVGGNKDKAKQGVEKGGDFADGRTGGKYSDKIDTGVEQAQDHIDKMPDQ